MVNYQVKDKAGKVLIVHHNQLKICTIPEDGVRPIYPVPETGEIEVIDGPLVGEGNPGCANRKVYKPNDLRVHLTFGKTSDPPPMHHGEFITH